MAIEFGMTKLNPYRIYAGMQKYDKEYLGEINYE